MSLFMESVIKRSELLKEWRDLTCRIAMAVKEMIPEAEVYVVGSVIRGDNVGGSDVDIVVVSKHIPERLTERAKLKAFIEERLGLPHYHPFEIHLLRPEEAEYYLERSKECVLKVT